MGEQSRERAMDRLLGVLAQAPRRRARGHFPLESLWRLQRSEPNLRLITMLRAPVDRVLSDYRYSRAPAHPT